ncbi:hypothetical protein I3843_07G221500 [Carya illinoinensis]|uniref:Uncharacterized protein n=1 Tax=Carya illinoinensis TaxID=32201 RepID=A0A922EMS7_CARIL|nr:hypothetical protein I3760_07G222200 [Carya illinoinensis]KAG6706573.1 hypothetical protein I3842_07G228100 [Carya illinoinensis]KAG7973317.1 hypothetical protein I3843_07G221500 [Carya illinoinensis]
MEPPKLTHDHEWVIQISRAIEEGLEKDDDEPVPTSIFSVPKTLMSIKPETYTPQLVALGPYHHQRLELLEMEHYKLASAMRVQKHIKEIKFRDLVNRIAESDCTIRASYHRLLVFDKETLAWIFAIDAAFILMCLQTYSSTTNRGSRISSKMASLIDYARKKTTHDHAILRDIIMLENQIPLFLLKEVHHEFYYYEDRDEVLANILLGFCKDLSPIKYFNIDQQHFREKCFARAHLLDLLYYMVAPDLQLSTDCEQEKPEEDEEIGWFRKAWKLILKLLWYIHYTPLLLLSRIFKSKVVTLILTIPLTIISAFSNRGSKSATAITDLISSAENVAENLESPSSYDRKDESPLIEEIGIPSVTKLHKIGVKFRPAKGGLGSTKFDKSSGSFYLPVIHLDDNSEVVLRNLVAYEACIAPEVMAFTRYTELMNGIIDTEEDVRILRNAGIILNRLKSDVEVATLWNWMTKSVRVTKVPVLDKAIEGANSYYSKSWKMRMNGNMKNYMVSWWPCLTFLAANILILLSVVQTACTIYTCSKWMQAL